MLNHVLLSIYCHPRNIKHPLTRSKYVVSSPTKPWFLRVGERDSEPYLSIYSSYSLIVIAMIPIKYPQDRWNPWLRWSDLLWRWVTEKTGPSQKHSPLMIRVIFPSIFPINIFNSLFQLIPFFFKYDSSISSIIINIPVWNIETLIHPVTWGL